MTLFLRTCSVICMVGLTGYDGNSVVCTGTHLRMRRMRRQQLLARLPRARATQVTVRGAPARPEVRATQRHQQFGT